MRELRFMNQGEAGVFQIESAMRRCRCGVEEFYNLAVISGAPPSDFNLAAELDRFECVRKGVLHVPQQYELPKHVLRFSNLVLLKQCPRNCPRVGNGCAGN